MMPAIGKQCSLLVLLLALVVRTVQAFATVYKGDLIEGLPASSFWLSSAEGGAADFSRLTDKDLVTGVRSLTPAEDTA